MRTRYAHIEATARNQTEKAFLCDLEYDGISHQDLWIPLSAIHEVCHDEIDMACAGDIVEIHVAEWWIKQQ